MLVQAVSVPQFRGLYSMNATELACERSAAWRASVVRTQYQRVVEHAVIDKQHTPVSAPDIYYMQQQGGSKAVPGAMGAGRVAAFVLQSACY